ncbi:MAG TPA: hypothetical protein ENI33_08125 [Thermoplasmatales archaeon]|nr:hypothetical protein [Thermoplasmatales archaeon]
MKRVSICIVIILFLSTVYFDCAVAENKWRVEWYKINKDTHEFEELVGRENWTAGNFEYNWLNNHVYNEIRDYIGFIAETKIYSDGGEYEFKLYEIDEEARIIIDDEEVLHSTTYMENIKVNLSKGIHTLKIEWKEYCCLASIGFSTDEKLFVEKEFKSDKNIELILVAFILVSAGIIILKFHERKEL